MAEYQVNETSTEESFTGSITALAGGGSISVYSSDDADGRGVYARKFDANGVASAAVLVNTTTALTQHQPDAATLFGDHIVVTWASLDQDGDGWGVYFQRFDDNMNPLGSETQVASTTALDQFEPLVASVDNSSFAIAWNEVDLSYTTNQRTAVIRAFDGGGMAESPDIRINGATAMELTGLNNSGPDQGFLLNYALPGQVFEAQYFDHVLSTSNTPFATTGTPPIGNTATDLGGYRVASPVSTFDTTTNTYSHVLELVDVAGGAVLDSVEIVPPTGLFGGPAEFDTATLTGGRVVVVWSETVDNYVENETDVFMRLYDVTGNTLTPAGAAEKVNTFTQGYQGLPEVAALADGGFVVNWNSGTGDYQQDGSIFGQRYDANGDRQLPGGDRDVANGDANPNTLSGDAGNNMIRGRAGDDSIQGGDGYDRLLGQAGLDSLVGEGGADELIGGGGSDAIYGGDGSDMIRGGGGGDTIFGENEHDIILGGGGADSAFGGQGHDIVYGGNGADRLVGNGGTDWLYGEGGGDRLVGNGGNDLLFGGNGADRMIGGAGNDSVSGGGGADRLEGRNGNDILWGENGQDTATGGNGADIFVFATAAESGAGASTRDTITDFTSGADKIDLSGVVTDPGYTGPQTLALDTAGPLANYGLLYDSGILSIDTDGDAIADLEIDLGLGTQLALSDFVFL